MLSGLRRSNPRLALALDRLVLRLPIYGRMKYLREILNLLFALEMLTAGGFSVEDALSEAAKVTSNQAFRDGLNVARDSIVRGENLSAAFLGNPVFSSRIGRWVAVGEKAGQVEQVFGQLRRYYQAEIEKWSSRFMRPGGAGPDPGRGPDHFPDHHLFHHSNFLHLRGFAMKIARRRTMGRQQGVKTGRRASPSSRSWWP